MDGWASGVGNVNELMKRSVHQITLTMNTSGLGQNQFYCPDPSPHNYHLLSELTLCEGDRTHLGSTVQM